MLRDCTSGKALPPCEPATAKDMDTNGCRDALPYGASACCRSAPAHTYSISHFRPKSCKLALQHQHLLLVRISGACHSAPAAQGTPDCSARGKCLTYDANSCCSRLAGAGHRRRQGHDGGRKWLLSTAPADLCILCRTMYAQHQKRQVKSHCQLPMRAGPFI